MVYSVGPNGLIFEEINIGMPQKDDLKKNFWQRTEKNRILTVQAEGEIGLIESGFLFLNQLVIQDRLLAVGKVNNLRRAKPT